MDVTKNVENVIEIVVSEISVNYAKCFIWRTRLIHCCTIIVIIYLLFSGSFFQKALVNRCCDRKRENSLFFFLKNHCIELFFDFSQVFSFVIRRWNKSNGGRIAFLYPLNTFHVHYMSILTLCLQYLILNYPSRFLLTHAIHL